MSRTDIISRRVDDRDRVRACGEMGAVEHASHACEPCTWPIEESCEGVLRIAVLQGDDLHDRLTSVLHVASRNIKRRADGWQVSGRGSS